MLLFHTVCMYKCCGYKRDWNTSGQPVMGKPSATGWCEEFLLLGNSTPTFISIPLPFLARSLTLLYPGASYPSRNYTFHRVSVVTVRTLLLIYRFLFILTIFVEQYWRHQHVWNYVVKKSFIFKLFKASVCLDEASRTLLSSS